MENHLLASVDDVSAHQCKRCKTSRENLEKNKTRIRGVRQVRSRVCTLETPTIEIFIYVIESDKKEENWFYIIIVLILVVVWILIIIILF